MIFKKIKTDLTRYSFGGTSAIITNLALITGLNTAVNARLSIVGSLLVIALADNVSDTLGIHIYQESEGRKPLNIWISTVTNFLSRLFISLGFVLIITILPLNIATIISTVYGLLVLSVISYIIAVNKKINPLQSVFEHLIIAVIVIFISKYLGGLIIGNFKNL
jgi:vacuolar iron transporter family protein